LIPYRKEITAGTRFLLAVRNNDGGIPATCQGMSSGCWTSASVLESLLSNPYHEIDLRNFLLGIIDFLLTNQITSGVEAGGWPLGSSASTMATGHATTALVIAQRFFFEDTALVDKLNKATQAGLRWLDNNKNDDGSWIMGC